MENNKEELSNCCNLPMIPPDWEMAEKMGILWSAYACYICIKCKKVCNPTPPKTIQPE